MRITEPRKIYTIAFRWWVPEWLRERARRKQRLLYVLLTRYREQTISDGFACARDEISGEEGIGK